MSNHDRDFAPKTAPTQKPGPFLAKVVSNIDPTYMGVLEVEILRPSMGDGSPTGLQRVGYMNPFYGVTDRNYVGKDPNDFNNTQKSYGMWFVPPDVGATVVVMFINGNPKRGYWMGCIMDDGMNFMIPGLAATGQAIGSNKARVPVGEYNKDVNTTVGDPERMMKPKHPFADVLAAQGLLADDARGTTTSSARRESPSSVFGISTPGPLDKRKDAKKGQVGKKGYQRSMFVSRLGGTTFVMDDGDANFLRTSHPKDGPPGYASLEQDEIGGDINIPHNELVRIRTRTGHQILLHNSEDLIYIGNARGTAWVELTSNGKIDIYAADDISMHTKGNFNITADKDINLTSTGGSINLNSSDAFKATAGGNYEIKAGADGMLTTNGNSNISAGGNHIESAQLIHMNGPGADQASTAIKATRIPQAEPWAGHENLHGAKQAPSTTTDTFLKEKT